jgi:O-acetyl-ADP-ribose deacetylase (regulator of RNase III)
MEVVVKDTIIRIVKGDITDISAQAIVNAANNQLWMGSGVAGAIKRKGGSVIEDEAVKNGPIPVGEAIATSAGDLNAGYVIHAAGMGADLRTDAGKIESATRNSLLRAEELAIESIAFPSIGTGVGGFSQRDAAKIMIDVATTHAKGDTKLKEIIFVLYGDDAYSAFEKVLLEKVK